MALARPKNSSRERLRGWACRIRTFMCKDEIYLFEHAGMFGLAWTDADCPVFAGE